jgi:hypothetical protein
VNRQDFYKFQVVGQADLDTLEDDVEVADAKDNALTSLGSYPATGLAVTVDGVTLVLSVAAGGGLATDASGNPRRVNLGAPANINLASAVPAVDPRWVLVALHFKRFEHQDVTDGDNVTLKYYLDESSELVMVQGAEGGAKPAIPADHVPLVDVRLIAAQAALARKDLDFIRCRPAWARNQGGAAQQLGDIAGAGFDNCRGFVVEPQASNAMKVGVRPGTFNLSDQLVTVAAGQTVTVPASPSGGKHRITLVYIDQAGTLQMAHGSEVVYAAQATAPSFEGRYPVAVYDVLDTTTALDPANLVDVRPHQRMARDVPNRYKFTAAGGETTVTIGNGWTFIVGAHALSVYKNGLLLAESAYAENAAGDGINGVAALGGGDVVELVAPRVAGSNPTLSHAAAHAAGGADPIDYSSVDGLVHALEMYSDVDEVKYTVTHFCGIIDGKLRSLAAPITRDPSGLAADAFLYCYAYWTGNAVAIIESLTPPNTDRRTISTASLGTGVGLTAAYLGTIRTTVAGNNKVRAFRRVGRRTTYLGDLTLTSTMAADGTVNNVLAFSQTGDMVLHTVGLSQAVPPHVKFAEWRSTSPAPPTRTSSSRGRGRSRPSAPRRESGRTRQTRSPSIGGCTST